MSTRTDSKEVSKAEGDRRAYTLCYLFLMEVIETIGTDKALELLSRAADRQADILEKETSSHIHREGSPREKGLEAYKHFMEDIGAQVTATPQPNTETTVKVGRCPIYEAYLSIGLECSTWMQGLCTNIVIPSIEKTIHKFEPRLRLRIVTYRASAEEPCTLRLQ